MNISSLFHDSARTYPDKIAIIDTNGQITYSELHEQVLKTAGYFLSQGVKSGDRVLVFVPMSINLYRIVLALFHIGATAVFLDEWVSRERLELCCKIADCTGFIGVTKARVYALFSKELRKIRVKLSIKGRDYSHQNPLEVSPNAAALITFTTGSTGTPKAALRTHGFLQEQFNALKAEIAPKPTDIDMTVLPIVLFVNLGTGCTSVIAKFKMAKPDKIKTVKIIKQIKDNQVNRIIASPYFVKKLAKHCLEKKDPLSNILQIFTGGAPVFPFEATLYSEAFPEAVSTIAYGSTEAEPISTVTASDLINSEPDSLSGLLVGEIYHRAEVKVIEIIDDVITLAENQKIASLALKDGEIGEIIVSGHHVLDKYFNNEIAFKRNKIISDGKIWHRTGDSGYFRENKLYLTGRAQQLINHELRIIAPFIVENQLLKISGVTCGTILQIENKLHLCIESARKIDPSNLKSMPHDRVHYLKSIPRDPRHHSKIDYESLRQSISELK